MYLLCTRFIISALWLGWKNRLNYFKKKIHVENFLNYIIFNRESFLISEINLNFMVKFACYGWYQDTALLLETVDIIHTLIYKCEKDRWRTAQLVILSFSHSAIFLYCFLPT